ncbi:response regulator [Parablautia intestinalis]|uniref:Circadian input-output histidine kinase CikA n=1 Tax=Parablautia intestinalis TaxID=2320100 RepID=A0A3A9AQH3_9FIRM|nr:response regulator [Parablautia intestinalis]RKI93607.1 response regulator [Parablautia intestinalis]
MEKNNVEDNNAQRIEQLEQKVAQLEAALQAAEEVNKAKSSFLSNMSHDIRTPMNAIVGMTAIGLSHIDEKARVQDCLNKIQTASAHLMSLVNDVLDMSRIDSGRLVLNEESFSLADLIHDISVIVRPQAAQKKQDLQIEIGEIQVENLLGDSLHLRQILVNIIGNAVKYTKEKGRIQVRFSQLTGDSKPVDNREQTAGQNFGQNKIWLDFWCRDNGIGMSSEFLKRIFLPFERVHSEATAKIEGTGLGMSIVKNLVESMGGEIRVESREGEGSYFYVRIPLAASPNENQTFALPKGRTVLIAEAGKDRAVQTGDYLKEAGLIPVYQKSGSQAVTYLTEARYEEQMPCALLLGEELSDMPVLNLAFHVRQLAGQEFPIILVSEADWAQLEYRAVRAGINGFVPCPLFKSRLLGVLSKLTGGDSSEDVMAHRKKDYSMYHVLLAEDLELNQEIAVELLSAIGVPVEVADNGLQAVEKFEKSPEGYYGLIFMDIHMPYMDGYEAARRIRKMDRADAEKVRIVAMTADAFVEDVRMAKEAGMDEHISKPVEPSRLQDIIYKQFV